MPRLTPSGVPISGMGQIPLDDHRVIGQRLVDGAWWICVDGVPVSDRGCNAIAAANGYWIAWLDGYGLFDANGLINTGAGLPSTLDGRSASAPDGTIAVCLDRQNGRGLALIGPGRKTTATVPDALLTDQICVVNSTQALWIDAARGLRTCGGLPVPSILPGPMGWPHVLSINGELWISYQSTDAAGMVLHPFHRFSGYRIVMPPAFYQDAVVLPGGIVRLTWARTSADTNTDSRDVNVATEPRTELFINSEQPPKPEPPKPEPPKMSVPDESQFARDFLGPRLRLVGSLDETRANSFEAVNAGANVLHANNKRWGLLEKTGGDRVRDRATDIWLYDLGDGTAQVVDVVGDAEGAPDANGVRHAPTPGWSIKDIRPIGQWREPYPIAVPIDPQPPQQPPAQPPPPNVDLKPLLDRIAALEAMDQRFLDMFQNIVEALQAATQRIQALESKPAPEYIAEGTTSRELYHSHRISVTLRPKQ